MLGMRTLFVFAALIVFAAAVTPMPLDSVTLEIVFPEKKTDRAQPYWNISMARGYSI
jgi:hypothetical protein